MNCHCAHPAGVEQGLNVPMPIRVVDESGPLRMPPLDHKMGLAGNGQARLAGHGSIFRGAVESCDRTERRQSAAAARSSRERWSVKQDS